VGGERNFFVSVLSALWTIVRELKIDGNPKQQDTTEGSEGGKESGFRNGVYVSHYGSYAEEQWPTYALDTPCDNSQTLSSCGALTRLIGPRSRPTTSQKIS
jgi:hypothetical protein